jgi:UDP-GlcNAc:undecaprenyl-phosphate GlcNAc-1-phosphate transferase
MTSPQLSAIYFVFRGLLLSLVVILILAWVSMRIAQRIRLLDLPGSAPHKSHTRPTPLAGGIALFSSLLICETLLRTLIEPTIRATFLAGAVVFLFGLLDDYWTLPPLMKLFGQILAALILIFSGVYIQIFESPEFFFYGTTQLYLYLDWLLTVFWVVGITNAFNFVDSMDGLAVGLGGMAAAFFVLLTLDSQQFLLSQHSVLIFGACLGLYFYNSPPALLFLGDSGSQTLGFILSVLAIAYNPQGAYQSSSWFVPVIMLGVPIFDTLLIVVSRLRRRRPIYLAAQDHTYHRLLRLLQSPNRAVLVMQISSLLLGCLAILGLNQPPLIANTIFLMVLMMGAAALVFLERDKDWV